MGPRFLGSLQIFSMKEHRLLLRSYNGSSTQHELSALLPFGVLAVGKVRQWELPVASLPEKSR